MYRPSRRRMAGRIFLSASLAAAAMLSALGGAPAASASNLPSPQLGQWFLGGDNGHDVLRLVYNPNQCADDTGRSKANGTVQQVWTCTGGTNQQWYIYVYFNDQYGNHVGTVTNSYSGKCLDDTGWSSTPGTAVQQWACGGRQDNQLWDFIPVSGPSLSGYSGPYALFNWNSRLCLYASGSSASGTQLEQLTCQGG